jgi:hypothetical protein
LRDGNGRDHRSGGYPATRVGWNDRFEFLRCGFDDPFAAVPPQTGVSRGVSNRLSGGGGEPHPLRKVSQGVRSTTAPLALRGISGAMEPLDTVSRTVLHRRHRQRDGDGDVVETPEEDALRNFNLSVGTDGAFWEAYETGSAYDLGRFEESFEGVAAPR